MQKLKVTIQKILRKNTSSLLLATSGSCGQICQFVTICVTAKCPLTAFEINSLLNLLHYIHCFSYLCISSSLPSRQKKMGLLGNELVPALSLISKIHQNLKADVSPWMMTCIWQRGNRRLAPIYTVARSCKSIPKKLPHLGNGIYAEEIVKHSFLWMQLHQNVSDSLKQKLSNSDKTLRTCKREFVQCFSFWTQLDSHNQ